MRHSTAKLKGNGYSLLFNELMVFYVFNETFLLIDITSGGGLFGNNNNQNKPGGLFGNTNFGSTNTNNTSSLFGANNNTNNNNSLFGGNNNPQPVLGELN